MLDETADGREKERQKIVLQEHRYTMTFLCGVCAFVLILYAVIVFNHYPYVDEQLSNRASYRNPIAW